MMNGFVFSLVVTVVAIFVFLSLNLVLFHFVCATTTLFQTNGTDY